MMTKLEKLKIESVEADTVMTKRETVAMHLFAGMLSQDRNDPEYAVYKADELLHILARPE
tara:strand:+ start:412 stop:591 length:180 start_codon:yes stop_codon:yes gene_type:complete